MKKILILGKGKSGLAAKKLAEKKGFVCTMANDEDDVFEESELSSFSFVVTSPGFSPQNKWILACKKAKLRLVSELDFGLMHLASKNVIAITGTNGKTTTASLLAQILSKSKKTFLLGNIGMPLCEKVLEIEEGDFVVLEVSSFMLFQSQLLHPKVAVILGISPDHKEWHGSFAAYKRAKLKIFENQTKDDFSVVYDGFCEKTKGKVLLFSTSNCVLGAYEENGNIIYNNGNIHEVVAQSSTVLLWGKHNMQNVLAAVAASKCLGISNEQISTTLKNFAAPEHRLQKIGEVKGILFVNDSKSTNPNSTSVAIDSTKMPIVLLAGGHEKGLSMKEPFEKAAKKQCKIVCFGECGKRFFKEAKCAGIKHVFLEENLQKAFDCATKCSKKGDVVLLSPGTSSFDEFQNYEERGRAFEQLVKKFDKKNAKTNSNVSMQI